MKGGRYKESRSSGSNWAKSTGTVTTTWVALRAYRLKPSFTSGKDVSAANLDGIDPMAIAYKEAGWGDGSGEYRSMSGSTSSYLLGFLITFAVSLSETLETLQRL